MSKNPIANQILSTAGAIPVKQKKGDVYMQKVKVQRYVAGKRPDYAQSSSESESDEEFHEKTILPSRTHRYDGDDDIERVTKLDAIKQVPSAEELLDPRIRRIMKTKALEKEQNIREFISSENEGVDEELQRINRHRTNRAHYQSESEEEKALGSDDEDYLTEEQQEAKRKSLKALNLQLESERGFGTFGHQNENQFDENLLEDELNEIEEEIVYSDEASQYSSSDDEDIIAPRLKPVFVKKKDRVTLIAMEKEEQKALQAEYEKKRFANERRNMTLKMVEAELRREAQEARQIDDILETIDSDEGVGDPAYEQVEYERWKVRELRRIRRDRETREALEKEKAEVERIHSMTEEERQQEFRINPKKITNHAEKGRYKFLQKYYHRGAFFVTDQEEEIFKRNYAAPTLEDEFDKAKLPSVMQVKNFGMAGRTKYTHLVDQDTTETDSAWVISNPQAIKFHNNFGGGFKEVFEKPNFKKKKESSSGANSKN